MAKAKKAKLPTKCESPDCEDIKAFVAHHKITMTTRHASANPNWIAPYEADHWYVTLRFGRRKLGVYYSLLAAHDGREPTIEEVLHCLALDACTIRRAPTFEKWADEFGYPTDTKLGERYERVKDDHDKLRKFIGEGFNTLLVLAET